MCSGRHVNPFNAGITPSVLTAKRSIRDANVVDARKNLEIRQQTGLGTHAVPAVIAGPVNSQNNKLSVIMNRAHSSDHHP